MSTEIPGPPNDWEQSEAWQYDPLASSEQEDFPSDEEISGVERRNKFRVRKHIGYIILFFLWLIAIIFSSSILVLLIHFLGPQYMHWLTDNQLSRVQSIVFSGATGAIVSVMMKRYLET